MRYELFVVAILLAFAWIAAPVAAEACMIREACTADGCRPTSTCAGRHAKRSRTPANKFTALTVAVRKRENSMAAKKKRVAEEQLIERSVDMINGGEYDRATALLYGTFGPKINSWALNATRFTEREHEIVLIVAIAILRSEGQHKRDSVAAVASEAERKANLRWAIIAVDGLAYVNYAEDRHVAEAWARDPATHDAAREKLWRLYLKSRLSHDAQFVLLAGLLRDVDRHDDAAKVMATSRETVK